MGTINNAMNNLKPWYRLNLDVANAISNTFNFTYPPEPNLPSIGDGNYVMRPHSHTSKQILCQKWKDNIQSILGADDLEVIVFYTAGRARYPFAHVDVNTAGTAPVCYGINWVEFYEDTRDMIWYKQDQIADSTENAQSTVGNFYQLSLPLKNNIIDTCRIGKQSTLVRTDIPHRISKPASQSQQLRVAVSIRPVIPKVDTWQEAVEYFQHLVISDN